MVNKPILIVDDEKNIRLTFSRALEALGSGIDCAENGKEANPCYLDQRVPSCSVS